MVKCLVLGVIQVFLQKPLGISFGRGRDGGAYVIRVDEARGNIDSRVQVLLYGKMLCQISVRKTRCMCKVTNTPLFCQVGDKVVNISASFGSDVWEAKNYGQVVYAIKTRAGEVYLRLQNKFGDLTALEVTNPKNYILFLYIQYFVHFAPKLCLIYLHDVFLGVRDIRRFQYCN